MSLVVRVREYRSTKEAAADLASFRLPRLPFSTLLRGTVLIAEGDGSALDLVSQEARGLGGNTYYGTHSGRGALLAVLPGLSPLDLPAEGGLLVGCADRYFSDQDADIPMVHKVLGMGRPRVMGVLNVTPDSFSDGGRFLGPEDAFRRAESMVEEGADIIDIGGESTRPGSLPISTEDELSRVMPVLRRITGSLDTVVSVDTTKPEVAEAAVEAGADIINDVSGLRDGRMARVAGDTGAAVVAMHMLGSPSDMQSNVTDSSYGDVVADVLWSLQLNLEAAERAGVRREKVIIDPGIGFGKTMGHNLELIRRARELRCLGPPVLIGASRKNFIGRITGARTDDRLGGSVGAATAALLNGAKVVRVHDVRETVQAARVVEAVRKGTA